MRQVPAIMHARWMSGEYIGDARPIGRVTIQRPNIALRRTPENLFSTLAFGGGTTPKELPNVASIDWQRGIDVDVSTCNISLHNTEPLPIGAQLTPDLDRPGWYTYNRGTSTFSGRWGHEVNEWSYMLMPDNILRTYEGYGCDPNVFPDDDPNLVLTGVWMIDDVDYSHDGTITVSCRDVGRILIDQIAFPPVVPFKSGFVTKDLPDGAYAYPVSFQGENSPSIDEIGSAEVRSSTSRLGMTYRTSSNYPYTGDGAVFGHYPRDAFDDDDSTYWLSIGNARPDQGYSFEWIEGAVKKQRVSSVRFKSRYTGHTAYLCLYVDEQGWIGSRKVPYDPNHPASAPNGADTMYHSTQVVTSTGWTEFNFEGVSNVTRVRVTFGNLQNSGLGIYPYRAGVRRMEAHGGASGGTVSTEEDFRIQYDIQHVVLDADQPPFPWGNDYPSATLTGTWRLTFNGQRTSAIQWDAGATQVKSALEGLSNVDEVSVTGTGTSGSPFVVSFIGEKVRGTKHPLMLMEHHDLRHDHSTTRVYRASDLPTIRTIHFEDKNYDDYSDIVKLLCAWGGFYWPEGATMQRADGSFDSYPFQSGDPAMTIGGYGRVWGDFQLSGTRGPAPIPADVFDKKPLMDGIAYVRDILGYLFYVDETGGAVFRPPNIYRVGNLFRTMGSLSGTRTSQMYTLDERQILVGLTAQLTGRNMRERTFVSNTTGTIGHMAAGWNPNPVGLRRVGGWTDQNFESAQECRVMAEMIALRQLFTYRSDNVTIAGFPGIQVDDQTRIFERTTSEGYIHYIKGISSSLNHQSGEYTYQLETHWLGEQPFEKWIFDPAQLSAETQRFLRGLYA